jgi:allantoinase
MKAGDDFFAIWGGISGCQSLLPALLSAGHVERGLPLTTVVDALAGNPARRFRMAGKGRIAVGCAADLVLVDLGERFTLLPEHLRYRHRHSPFVGMPFTGKPRQTILRGETVAIDGETVGTPRGRLVTPGYVPPA